MVVNFAEGELNNVDECNELLFVRNTGFFVPVLALTVFEEVKNCLAEILKLFKGSAYKLLNICFKSIRNKFVKKLFIKYCREQSDVLSIPVWKQLDAFKEVFFERSVLVVLKLVVNGSWVFKL